MNEFEKSIVKGEKRFSLQAFRYREANIWPFIRVKLYLSHKKSGSSLRISIGDKLIFLLLGVRQYLLFKIDFLWRRKSIDNLFVTSRHYKVLEIKQYRDRIIDPFITLIQDKEESFAVSEYSGTYKYDYKTNYDKHIVKVQPIIYFLSFFWKAKFYLLHEYKLNPIIKELRSFVKKTSISYEVNKNLSYQIYALYRQSRFYEKLIHKYRIKRIFLVCYYDYKCFATVWAANRLNLPSIDLQHGVQGSTHLAYAQMPLNSMMNNTSLLPSHFWTWNKYSKSVISEWYNADNVIHGNNKYVIDQIKKDKAQILLVSIQPLVEAFPTHLIEAIKEYSGDYKWYIRLHPSQLSNFEHFKSKLNSLGVLDLVNLKEASFNPLSDLLNTCALHITIESTVAIEASYFGVKTVFLGSYGFNIFSPQIDTKLLELASDCDSLLKIIEEFDPSFRISQTGMSSKFENINSFFETKTIK